METPKYVDDIVLMPKATMEMSSPFKTASVAFNWVNRDYPIYHEHSHWELFVIMSGEILHNVNGRESILKKGNAYLIRPTDRHFLKYEKENKNNFQQINFLISDDFARKLFSVYECYEELLLEKDTLQFTLDSTELSVIYDKALLTQNMSQQKYEMSTKLIVSRIMASFFEQRLWFNTNYPKWLNEFIVYVNNPNSFGKSTKELAECTPYSYSRLATLFKQYVGKTIVEYVNDKKMVYSKRLLRTTNLTTLQISEMIGYNSLSSFNHLFKDAYGVTPSEYRKEHHKK